MSDQPLHLFAGFGVELEYMIVDAQTLSVRPLADQLLAAAAGEPANDYEDGDIGWSNELVNHVIELKTNGPASSLTGLETRFADNIAHIHRLLEPLGARLMPSAMHPWMDPLRETQLWPREYSEVYQAFDRIFNCRGHGWSNLQSIHLNLPFADDAEFARLHAAIRLVLPILPALAASSPFMEGRATERLDNRLHVYRSNCARIPSISGRVIPEPVYSRADYERVILQRIYADIAPHDPNGVLQEEWLNARGAIARFERNTIEIRVLDIQECPQADLAIVRAIVAVLRALVAEKWSPLPRQQAWPIEPLERIFLATVRDAEHAAIEDREYLQSFGVNGSGSVTAGQLWRHLADTLALPDDAALRCILEEGTLARRIRMAASDDGMTRMQEVYGRLCECLAAGRMFISSQWHDNN